jgi:hypothetical protein
VTEIRKEKRGKSVGQRETDGRWKTASLGRWTMVHINFSSLFHLPSSLVLPPTSVFCAITLSYFLFPLFYSLFTVHYLLLNESMLRPVGKNIDNLSGPEARLDVLPIGRIEQVAMVIDKNVSQSPV